MTAAFLLIGGVIGFIVRELFQSPAVFYMHPEMLDEYGNVLPDEILAVRFENDTKPKTTTRKTTTTKKTSASKKQRPRLHLSACKSFYL